MVNILVTGALGQLGSTVKKISGKYTDFRFTYVDIKDLDLTNAVKATDFFTRNDFNYIINCAAYTAVDQAEKDTDSAFAVNSGIPAFLGNICEHSATRLIHISTDFVYNGKAWLPHKEDEETGPVSAYAKSKLEGEKSLWHNDHAIVIRTSWLYSEFGNNFLKTMIRLSKERSELGVVFDQTGTPTYAGDLADAILQIIDFSERNEFKPGIYNYSNEGVCSWFDFSVKIMNAIQSACVIKPIHTNEYPLPAQRPEYSVMDKQKIRRNFGIAIPYWHDSLIVAIRNLEK